MNSYANITQYIADFPPETKKLLKEIHTIIKQAAPKAEEAISYGIPTFKQNGNLVHFGGFKNHIGFFPGSSGVANFKTELGKYKTSKGTIQFPLDKPLPKALIKKIVKFRIKENNLK